MTVKGIDNDASFSSWQIGLQKYALNKRTAARFGVKLKDVCDKIHGADGELADSGTDWAPLVKRFESELGDSPAPLSIIWP